MPKFCTYKNFPLYSSHNMYQQDLLFWQVTGVHCLQDCNQCHMCMCVVCVCVCVCVWVCVLYVCEFVCVCVCIWCVCMNVGVVCVCRVYVLIGLCPCICIKTFREINSQKHHSKWYSCSTTSSYSGWVYKLVKALKLGSLERSLVWLLELLDMRCLHSYKIAK